MQARFDVAEVFDTEDYPYFYADRLSDERSEEEAELVWRLLGLEPGARVLDLACGHGRIANRLAARGAVVTGLDLAPAFLDLASQDAAHRGVEVTYVEGDMRDLPWREEFDAVVSWFTSYGYFDDADNRRVLDQVHAALRRGGRLLVDLNHRDSLMTYLLPSVVVAKGRDMMIDTHTFDPLTSRLHNQRTVIRGERIRRFRFFTRLFGFTELRAWLEEAGFETVEAWGDGDGPLTLKSRRMRVRAVRDREGQGCRD